MTCRRYTVFFWACFAMMLVLGISTAVVSGEENQWDEIEETRDRIEELEKQVVEIEASLRDQERMVRGLEDELREVEVRLERAEEDLEKLQLRLDETRGLLGSRIRSIYVNGSANLLDAFLNAENLGDMILRTEYLARIFKQDARLVEELRLEGEQARQAKEEVERDREKAAQLYQREKAERQRLEEMRREQEELLYAAKDELKGRLARLSTRAEAPPVYGVVIDNAGPARPQHGFAEAHRVYEFEVEGGITRYLALYSEFPQQVGPIRSARRHSILLALENDVHFIYASASSDNLQRIRDLNLRNTNALRHSNFERCDSRRAPHNLYGNLATLGAVSPPDESDIRPVYPEEIGEAVEEFSFALSSGIRVSYRYDSREEIYRRYVNNVPHRDAGGDIITARNVIIQHVSYYTDESGRPTARIIGRGSIDFYSNGQHFRGTWEKGGSREPTRYFYQSGQEIEIPYGATWIQLQRR